MARQAQRLTILGVDYTHLALKEQGDLYLTDYGVPFVECLLPENFWTDREWFQKNSERLSGTSSLYRVLTKNVSGLQKEIVLKWNRMGQDPPGGDEDGRFTHAEFNSPFEEFSLTMELMHAVVASGTSMEIHRPLAIFVPSGRIELWQMGRKEYMMQAIIEKHAEIDLDMFRSYAVIYEWMVGLDASEACTQGILNEAAMRRLTLDAESKMADHGFEVKDRKPHHIIITAETEEGLREDEGHDVPYGVIDFELLKRTLVQEEKVKHQRRKEYLRRQRDRFRVDGPEKIPSHLKHVNIMGVDYIYGHCESTGGALWVVGRDPDLFDYFLPERWEKTPRMRLSAYSEIYHTLTKDDINLVWKVSKVGVQPDMDPIKEDEKRIIEFGYNSPFEEVSLAMTLTRGGIPTVYPRAIYMMGVKTEVPDALLDDRRYQSHEKYTTPDDTPILRRERDYVAIWGYWNGLDDKLADEDRSYYTGINALRACRTGIITTDTYLALMKSLNNELFEVGVEDLNLRGSHILLSMLTSTGHLITDRQKLPEIRICSFELLRRLPDSEDGHP